MLNTLRVKSILWLVAPVLFSGCITSNTLHAIKYNTTKELPDYIDRVERASLTDSNQLLICFEGRLTNALRSGHYTMVVRLSDLKVRPYRRKATETNTPFCWSEIQVKRTEIVDGWPAKGPAGDAEMPVPVGPPFLDGWFTNRLEKAGTLKPVPGADRTVFQVLFEGTNAMPYPSRPALVYVDAKRPETFTDIKLERVVVVEQHKELVVAIPFAVAADIATLPFQFLFVCFYLSSPHC
jgi:hypothetical protein